MEILPFLDSSKAFDMVALLNINQIGQLDEDQCLVAE